MALFDAAGKELARLTLGKEVEGTPALWYVRGTRDQVLQADSTRLADLPQSLFDVLDAPAPDAGATAPWLPSLHPPPIATGRAEPTP